MYASIVWDDCAAHNSDILDKIQNKAARIVTGLTRSVSLDKLNKECGWLSLAERRRRQQILSFMFKAHFDLLPTYISDLMPPLVRNISNYSLRIMSNYSVPFARTEIFKKSCIPSAITLWNAADNSLKDSKIHSFKYQMKKPFAINSKVPSYYASGNRRLSVLHARIRNNCSNLNLNLFNNFLRPDPLCSCQVEPEKR